MSHLEFTRALTQAAVEASTSELMLFGVASLLLTIFQDPIASICSKSQADIFW